MRPFGFWMEARIGALLAIACFLSFLLAQGAHAEQPQSIFEKLPLRVTECRQPECLIVNVSDLKRIFEAYEARIEELEKQLTELQKSKGCAKLEVTEPPRNFVPKKKDHDARLGGQGAGAS